MGWHTACRQAGGKVGQPQGTRGKVTVLGQAQRKAHVGNQVRLEQQMKPRLRQVAGKGRQAGKGVVLTWVRWAAAMLRTRSNVVGCL